MSNYIKIPYTLQTVLGSTDFIVEVDKHEYELSSDIIFKPYEEERLHKEQCIRFLNYLHNGNINDLTEEKLRFIIRTFSI